MTPVIVLGVLLAAGLLQLRWLVFPPTPDLVAEAARWERDRELITQREGDPSPRSAMTWLARWVSEKLAQHRPEALEKIAPDLAITQTTLQGWLTKVSATAVAFALAPLMLMLGREVTGQQASLQWAPVFGALLGVLAIALSVKDLRERATRAREEYTRALSIYLDLVAMSMAAGQGHAQALPAAAQIGTGRVFGEIRSTINLAPSRGITAWQALGQLGERYQIWELVTLRSSIELAQDDGARVKASLIARAETMRSSRLAAAVERANKSTESMRQLTLIAAILAAVYICSPYILALRGAGA